MRKLLRIALLFAFAVPFAGIQAQTSGGPDAYGYEWTSSGAAGGPAFSWIDSTGRGFQRVMGLTDDNAVGPVNLGFDFHYYWTDYNEIKVGSNGWLGLNNIGNIAACFPTIPTAGGSGDNFIAPYMSDLNYSSSYPAMPNPGELWWWTNNVDSAIFTWYNVPWWKDDAGGASPPDWEGSNTFQVVLSATDSSITINYLDVDQAAFTPSGFCTTDLEIGIENITGNIGLAAFSSVVPQDSFTVKFEYPHPVTFQVPDATPSWNANADNAGQFYLAGANVDMTTSIENVGNTNIGTAITVDGELLAIDLTTILWSDNSSLPSLNAGIAQNITFPTQAVMGTAGQYYYNVEISNGDDINPSNNSNSVEISVVDNVAGVYGLTYATGNPPDGALAWGPNSGEYGGGIYIDPPAYPAQINSVDCFILGDGDVNTPMPNGFKVQIFEPDVNGDPGTILAQDSLAAGSVTESDWNTINFTSPPTVNAGGFFVSWIQGGDGIGLGTEAFGPISRRTYEILNGQWAPYREIAIEDMLIRVNIDATVAVDPESDHILTSLELYPNPANSMVTIGYNLARRGDVKVSIMDLLGREMYAADHRSLSEGNYRFAYDASKLEAGVYLITLETGSQRMTKKLIVSH